MTYKLGWTLDFILYTHMLPTKRTLVLQEHDQTTGFPTVFLGCLEFLMTLQVLPQTEKMGLQTSHLTSRLTSRLTSHLTSHLFAQTSQCKQSICLLLVSAPRFFM